MSPEREQEIANAREALRKAEAKVQTIAADENQGFCSTFLIVAEQARDKARAHLISLGVDL